jgi:ribosomal protein L37AE/L43A
VIKEKEVEIILAAGVIKNLIELGYELPTHLYRGEKKFTTNIPFTVKVEHLSKKSHVKITRICDGCGKERVMRYEKYKDLCHKCASYKIGLALVGENNGMFGMKGELHPNWNPNRTAQDKLDGKLRFQCKEAQRWSRKVKEVFDFICQKCKHRGTSLVSHHIESWYSNVELRLDVSNGICLCKKCHASFHKMYGKKQNNRIQLIEFLGEDR